MLPVTNAASMWATCEARDAGIPLLELLRNSRDRLATQPADKLYATFGLAKEIQVLGGGRLNALLEPDYTKPVVDVYRDASLFLIIEYGNLDALSHAGGTGVTDNSKWPSWVPDWSEVKASTEYAVGGSKSVHRADANQPLTMGIPQDDHMLVLKGLEIDTVQSYGDRLTSYGIGYQTYQEERDFVIAAWSMFSAQSAHQDSPYRSKSEVLRNFTLSLTAGLSNLAQPADQDPNYGNDAARWFSEHLKDRIPAASWMQRLAWPVLAKADPGRFHEAFVRACLERRFFVSQGGYMGVGPEAMKDGDRVVVLFGGKVPYILRRAGPGWRFIGDAYVPGLMEGQAVERWKASQSKETTFEIV